MSRQSSIARFQAAGSVLFILLFPAVVRAAGEWQSLGSPQATTAVTPTGYMCAGGSAADDGSFEDGFGVPNIFLGTPDTMVQRLIPSAYPAQLTKACICWRVGGSGGGHLPFTVVAYADGAIPGALLGSVTTDTGTLLAGTATFIGISCVPMNAVVLSGGIYVGIKWNHLDNQDFFVCGDTSSTTPVAAMFSSTNDGNAWHASTQDWPQLHSLGIRAQFAPPQVSDPDPPNAAPLTSSQYPNFRFWVRISDARLGTSVADCVPETVCVAGAIPTRAEVFVRIVGPKMNGYLWPNIVKFNTTKTEVWIQQVSTGDIQYYLLPALATDSDTLPGVVDKTGFLP